MVLKELILTVFTLGGCDGTEELIFNNVYYGEGLVILKELIFNSFYYGRVW